MLLRSAMDALCHRWKSDSQLSRLINSDARLDNALGSYTASHRMRCNLPTRNETPSREDFDMTPLAKAAKNIAMTISLLLVSAAATADDAPLPTQVVDLANKLNGVHPGFRAFHAKGVVVEGSFKASPDAARLSRAPLFNGRTIPVTVRFSDGNGMPNVADGSPAANPHGMAIKYHLPGGVDTDMVIVSLKFFPVGTGEDFRDLLLAISQSPPNAQKPTKFDQFVANHPSVPKAFATVSTPDSFADEEYYGIDAFVFVSKDGRKQAVRYMMVPEKVVHLTPEEAGKKTPDFLVGDLPRRIAQKPVVF